MSNNGKKQEMSRDEHRAEVERWLGRPSAEPVSVRHSLRDAVYTMSELHLWPDSVDSLSVDQVMMCWHLVEVVRKRSFPDELRM
jgi:hypothetical protein